MAGDAPEELARRLDHVAFAVLEQVALLEYGQGVQRQLEVIPDPQELLGGPDLGMPAPVGDVGAGGLAQGARHQHFLDHVLDLLDAGGAAGKPGLKPVDHAPGHLVGDLAVLLAGCLDCP